MFGGAESSRAVEDIGRDFGLVPADDAVPERLVIIFELLEFPQTFIEVHAEVGDDVADVVWAQGIVLNDDPHNTAYELNVGRKTAEGSEDGGDAEFRVVEAFAEHLNLNDAIERAVAKISEDRLLGVGALIAVYHVCAIAAFLVQRTNLSSMVDGARDSDELVPRATLSKLLEFL